MKLKSQPRKLIWSISSASLDLPLTVFVCFFLCKEHASYSYIRPWSRSSLLYNDHSYITGTWNSAPSMPDHTWKDAQWIVWQLAIPPSGYHFFEGDSGSSWYFWLGAVNGGSCSDFFYFLWIKYSYVFFSFVSSVAERDELGLYRPVWFLDLSIIRCLYARSIGQCVRIRGSVWFVVR